MTDPIEGERMAIAIAQQYPNNPYLLQLARGYQVAREEIASLRAKSALDDVEIVSLREVLAETERALDAGRAGEGRKDAEIAVLRDALRQLLDAEWMVSHDWGGDRKKVLEAARAALEGRRDD